MKNYSISGLGPEGKELLSRTQIDFCELEFDGANCVVIDEKNILLALKALGMKIKSEQPSSIDGIVQIVLEPGQAEAAPELEKDFTITVKSWEGNGQTDFLRAVKEILLPVMRKDIVLTVPHGSCLEPASDGRFHINIWSSLKNFKVAPPKKIWGIEVDCTDASYLPSGQGVAIVDPDTRWAVAEIIGDNLYIHHDLCHKGTNREVNIFRHLLEEVVMEISLSPEKKAAREKRIAAECRERSREQYIKECQKRLEKTLTGTKKAISDGHKKINELQQELVKKVRETSGAERKLQQLEACCGGELEKYGREFDALLDVQGVEGVQTADGVINVFTEHIYITPDNCLDTFDIGKFRMEIYTSGSNGCVKFFNITRKGSGANWNIHHPHVNSSGDPCLGNIKEIVGQLVGEYEFSAVAQLGLQFLKSVNTEDSAGEGIFDAWPKVQK